MANKRMFNKQITESDAFLDMPSSSQALYFHLNLNADDEGFVNAPNKVLRNCGAAKDDLNLLLLKKFIIAFDNGIIVIKHWRMHNWIRTDRIKDTAYQNERLLLELDKNGVYSRAESVPALEVQPLDRQKTGKRLTNGDIEQSSLDQSSLVKSSLEQSSQEEMSDKEVDDDDDSLKKIIDVFEQQIPNVTLTENDKNEMLALLNDLPEDMIIKAILQASPYKPNSWNYIKVILDSCVRDGVKEKLNPGKSNKAKTGKYEDVYRN
ncbi:MAG: DnaD domain protein [Firmicutes bacterium]|nr:DnaD domain protein [Bacillota bacterium]